KRGTLDLQLLERRHRIPLDDRRGAAAGRVKAGLRLLLDEQDVGHAALTEEVGERGAGDAAADDHDVEAVYRRHPSHPSPAGGGVKKSAAASTSVVSASAMPPARGPRKVPASGRAMLCELRKRDLAVLARRALR